MNIKINPKVVRASTKSELVRKIHSLSGQIGIRHTLRTKDDSSVILYNLEKHRKKTAVNKRKKKIQHTNGVSFQRDIIAPAQWVAYVYFIPKALVKKSSQGSRTFEVEFN